MRIKVKSLKTLIKESAFQSAEAEKDRASRTSPQHFTDTSVESMILQDPLSGISLYKNPNGKFILHSGKEAIEAFKNQAEATEAYHQLVRSMKR